MINLSPINDLIGKLEHFIYVPSKKKVIYAPSKKKAKTNYSYSTPIITENRLRGIKKILKKFSGTITDTNEPLNDRENLFSTLNLLLRTLNKSQKRAPLLLRVERIIILAIKHFAPQKSPEFSHPYALDLIFSELPSRTLEERVESLNTIRGFYATAPERVPVWIAHWISKQEIRYRHCQTAMSPAEIDSILPHLKYLNFEDSEVLPQVIQRAPKLEVLIANSGYPKNTFPISPILKILDCSYSNIQFLPEKMPYLQVLKCKSSTIVSFPKFDDQEYSKLTHFIFEAPRNTTNRYPTDFDSKYISEVNRLLERSPHLRTLSMTGQKRIIEHIKIPFTVRSLSIVCWDLESISYLPENLAELTIRNCYDLVEIPRLPDSLVRFECDSVKIRPLDELPPKLEIFDFLDNKAWSKLPHLPKSLRFLRCISMNLRSLPELPPFLEELDCSFNCLSSLPELPESLRVLDVDDNML